MRCILLLLVILGWGSCTMVQGQLYYNQVPAFRKANSVWAFGINAGLDFNGGAPVAIRTGITSFEGLASVADPVTGSLLFYSRGSRIWNAAHQLMPNGVDLFGNEYSTTQGVCIVPFIGVPGKYYHFSLHGYTDGPSRRYSGHLYYSIVDMALNNGSGDVVAMKKNILLDNDTLSESMIAVPGNNCDIWLVVHTKTDPIFKSYHITAQGIDPIPVISVTGTQIQGVDLYSNNTAYSLGGMAVSPNRSMIAIVSGRGDEVIYFDTMGTSGILLCKFDANSGKLSEAIQVDEKNTNSAYVPAFSPDNSKLYFSRMEEYTFPNGWVWPIPQMQQFDLSVYDAQSITLSRKSLGPVPWYSNSYSPTSYLRLYGDTIYINVPGSNGISLICKPNLPGAACDFQSWPEPISLLPQTTTYYSLPNEVVYPFPPDTSFSLSMDTTICSTDGTPFGSFELAAPPGFTTYVWNDGETAQIRKIVLPGLYRVMSTDGCHSRMDTFKIRYKEIPPFTLGPDTALCFSRFFDIDIPEIKDVTYLWQDSSMANSYRVAETGVYWLTLSKEECQSADTIQVSIQDFTQELEDTLMCNGTLFHIRLQANVPSDAEVLWSNGSKDSFILVQDAGIYWVKVQNSLCAATDTATIKDSLMCTCFFNVPTVFSPNGDGLNDLFLPLIEQNCPVRNYQLQIFNRFGQRIFSSSNPAIGWNGSLNGAAADIGTYFYELRFEGGSQRNSYYRKGDIVLLR